LLVRRLRGLLRRGIHGARLLLGLIARLRLRLLLLGPIAGLRDRLGLLLLIHLLGSLLLIVRLRLGLGLGLVGGNRLLLRLITRLRLWLLLLGNMINGGRLLLGRLVAWLRFRLLLLRLIIGLRDGLGQRLVGRSRLLLRLGVAGLRCWLLIRLLRGLLMVVGLWHRLGLLVNGSRLLLRLIYGSRLLLRLGVYRSGLSLRRLVGSLRLLIGRCLLVLYINRRLLVVLLLLLLAVGSVIEAVAHGSNRSALAAAGATRLVLLLLGVGGHVHALEQIFLALVPHLLHGLLDVDHRHFGLSPRLVRQTRRRIVRRPYLILLGLEVHAVDMAGYTD
jgi:hypothetical protein